MKVLTTAALLALISTAPASAAGCAAPASAKAAIPELARLINTYRSRNGAAPLKIAPPLVAAAQGHACDMVATGRFSHDGKGGAKARMKRAGCRTRKTGETIAMGYSSPKRTLQQWIESPPHRQILLMRNMTVMGIGLAEPAPGQGGGPRWVLDVSAGC